METVWLVGEVADPGVIPARWCGFGSPVRALATLSAGTVGDVAGYPASNVGSTARSSGGVNCLRYALLDEERLAWHASSIVAFALLSPGHNN